MVYYFTSTATSPAAQIYVGKDKFENEDLIAHGLDNDVWFHVDNLSSAHIYLRLPTGSSMSWDAIPPALLADLAQLTKANSIEGNKKANITVIYTPWANLRKDGSMATGQVSFHDAKKVRRVHVAARENAIVNRLNKTREERYPDLAKEKEDALAELRRAAQADARVRAKQDAKVAKARRDERLARDHAYDDWNDEGVLAESSNANRAADWEDDFM